MVARPDPSRRRGDPVPESEEEVLRELAALFATGYLRLLAEAAQRPAEAPYEQPSGAPRGQECALDRRQNDLELLPHRSPDPTDRWEPPAGRS